MFKRIGTFFTEDIWRLSFGKSSPIRAFFLRWIRIIAASCHGLIQHQSFLRAGLLSYYSLLALVPILAVAFGIAKGFGFEHFFERQLLERFQEERIVVEKIINFAHNLLHRASEGLIIGIGLIVLFWTAWRLLGNIEAALNDVWEVREKRSFARQVTDYMALVIFCPFFIVFSSTIAIFVITQIGEVAQQTPFLRTLKPAISHSFHFVIPLILNWVLFSFLYIVMPNTRVQLKYGLIAGVVAGTAYQLVQWSYITFQIGVSRYGAIYGSFAALPLFLVWVHISWIIFLVGAEIGYHAEDESYARLRYLKENGQRVEATKLEVGLLITYLCIRAFCQGKTAPTLAELSDQMQIPFRMTRRAAEQLVETNVLSEVQSATKERAYHPAQDVKNLTVQFVVQAMAEGRQQLRYLSDTPEFRSIRGALKAYDAQTKSTSENIPLYTLVEKNSVA